MLFYLSNRPTPRQVEHLTQMERKKKTCMHALPVQQPVGVLVFDNLAVQQLHDAPIQEILQLCGKAGLTSDY